MIDAAARADRLARLRTAMADAGVGLLALAPTDNLRWLTGFTPLYDERLCLTLVSAGGAAVAVPALNAEQTADHVPELPLVRWADEAGPQAALRDALTQAGPGAGTLAVDPEMRADHLLALQAALPGRAAIDGTGIVGPLREVKDADELDLLRRSSEVADLAMREALEAIGVGMSESDVAEVIDATFRGHGCEPEFAIVGAGAHGAYPHHESGATTLADGDAVVIDLGAVRDGYHSDITRMAFLGEPTDRYREVHDVVEAAVVAAMAAVAPGASAGVVDAAARSVISDAGYGEFFVHRTGHGLGLSGHEPPYIMDGSAVTLREGMVFSIEPGIYLPGEFGVRLEDIVHVTADGCARLSELSREIAVIS